MEVGSTREEYATKCSMWIRSTFYYELTTQNSRMALLDLANELQLAIAETLESERDINAFAQPYVRCFQLLNSHLYRYNVQQNRRLALFWAAKHGNLNTVVKLLDQGANVHSQARQRKLGIVIPLLP